MTARASLRPFRHRRSLPATRLTVLRPAVLAAALLAAMAPGRPSACAFHPTLAGETLSQKIANSPTLIAARPAPDNPFRFVTHLVLKGAAPPVSPPQLVDTATRGRLARDPASGVLFAHDEDGTWTRLLLLDGTTGPVVQRMLEHARHWSSPGGAAARRDFAAGLLAQPDRRLRRLALRELDALDYAVLRRGSYPVTAEAVLGAVDDMREPALAPTRILLLGILGGERAGTEIAARIRSRLATGSALHLGAWTTAAIEAGRAEGLAGLERTLDAAHGPLTEDQLAGITRALIVQRRAGEPALRIPLGDALVRLADRHPLAAPLILRTLAKTSDRTQADLVRRLVTSRALTSAPDLVAATAYLAGAITGSAASRTTEPGLRGLEHRVTRQREGNRK